ncbi:MAG: FtsH protease activity modulator HflK [Microgenomates group bacterium]|jgi:membrane protease subunit HflK
MAGSGGPWGGGGSGGSGGGDDDRNKDEGRPRGNGRPRGDGPQIPEIDELMRKGQEQLRVLMGGRGRGTPPPMGGGGSGGGAMFTKQGLVFGGLAALALWAYASVYQVRPEEQAVTLTLGEFSGVTEEGLQFAPWPVMTAEIVKARNQRTTVIGSGADGELDKGLMLTRDQNIVDLSFEVVWNINDPAKYLFNLAEPEETIRAVAESAMRDIIARTELAPILNTNQSLSEGAVLEIQAALDSYSAGINVIRVNFVAVNPPREVIDSVRKVQAAQQERDRLEKEADAYANTATAGARGQAAQLLQEAEGYRAQVVNNAEGEASRFLAVYGEYVKSPEVTRKRMYLETMEKVLGGMNKVILDGVEGGGQGVVPYLPLDSLTKPATVPGGTN